MKIRNEKRSGYKHTKVGWIPEDWDCVPGKSAFANSKEKGHKDLPILSVTLDSGIVHRDTLDRKMPNAIAGDLSLRVRAGDIAYNMMRAWQGAIGLVRQEGVISPAYVALRPKKGVHSPFMFYLLKSSHYLYLLQSYSYGLTGDRLRLYYKDFGLMPVTLPPFAEQKRIAGVLSVWDQAIALMGRLIDAKQRMKRGIMQKLLTAHLRFSQFGKPTQKQGELPKGWKSGNVGDLVHVNKDNLSEATSPEYTFTYIDLSCVESGHISYPTETISFGQAPLRARRVARKGDVLMSTVRPNLQGYAIVERNGNIVCSTGFAVLSSKDTSSSAFVYHALFSDNIQKQLATLIAGSNYPAVNASDVRHLRLIYPERQERDCVAACLSACNQEIQLLTRKRACLQEQKKGLMQKLLSGQIRIKSSGEVTCND